MRLLRADGRARPWLAAGVVGAGLLVGGAWYAGAHGLAPASQVDDLTQRAFAREAPAASLPLPAPKPSAATKASAAAKPSGAAAANSKRPSGEVTQMTAEPAAFTMQKADGTLATYRVLDTTVFMAGRDRPYRFDLLKAGDTVIVRGGSPGKAQASGAVNARGKPKPARGAGAGAAGDAEQIARQVMVRPAGEARAGKKGRGTGVQNGGSDGAGE